MNDIRMQWTPAEVLLFIDEASTALNRYGPAHMAALAPAFGKLFRNTSLLTALVNAYLARVLSGHMDKGDPAISLDALVLCHSPVLTLRIIKPGVQPRATGRATLVSYPANTLLLVATPKPVAVGWYRLVDGADFDVFDATLKLRHDGVGTVANGALLYVDARCRFPHFPERPDAIYVALGSAPVNAQVVSFDPLTLAPLGASMASDDASALCVMLGLLDPALPGYPTGAVKDLTGHPDHHVRWAAATALGRYERGVALDIVRTLAAQDPHRFIRAAARRTLQLCEAAP